MEHVGTPQPPVAGLRVKAVPFGQKVFERPGPRFEDGRAWPVTATERHARSSAPALTDVRYGVGRRSGAHARPEVRQVEEASRRPDRERVARVEADEPDP